MADTDSADRSSGRRGKVARLLAEYGVESLGPELAERWTAEGDDRLSLRALATRFNVRLLETTLSEADTQPLSGDVDTIYRLLTDEDVSTAERTRVRRRLERESIDVDALVDDFVSYQAIRTYLNNRGVERETTDRPRAERDAETIQRLRGRVVTVTEEKLDRLARDGHISLGDSRVLASVTVLCDDCGTQYEVTELLDRGGCDCELASV